MNSCDQLFPVLFCRPLSVCVSSFLSSLLTSFLSPFISRLSRSSVRASLNSEVLSTMTDSRYELNCQNTWDAHCLGCRGSQSDTERKRDSWLEWSVQSNSKGTTRTCRKQVGDYQWGGTWMWSPCIQAFDTAVVSYWYWIWMTSREGMNSPKRGRGRKWTEVNESLVHQLPVAASYHWMTSGTRLISQHVSCET